MVRACLPLEIEVNAINRCEVVRVCVCVYVCACVRFETNVGSLREREMGGGVDKEGRPLSRRRKMLAGARVIGEGMQNAKKPVEPVQSHLRWGLRQKLGKRRATVRKYLSYSTVGTKGRYGRLGRYFRTYGT
jgi:hypothetical protein